MTSSTTPRAAGRRRLYAGAALFAALAAAPATAQAAGAGDDTSLRAENQRLRQQIEDLQRQRQ